MKNLKSKTNHKIWNKGVIVPLCLFFLFLAVMVKGIMYVGDINRMQNIDLTRQAIKRAVVQCYAIEGRYPSDVEYLEEHYGLEINHDKYFIVYDCFASNIMPSIEVFEGGAG